MVAELAERSRTMSTRVLTNPTDWDYHDVTHPFADRLLNRPTKERFPRVSSASRGRRRLTCRYLQRCSRGVMVRRAASIGGEGHSTMSPDRRLSLEMRCVCGGPVDSARFGSGVQVARCMSCDRWFTITRRTARRRLAQFLVRTISFYSHPDETVFVPWLPL